MRVIDVHAHVTPQCLLDARAGARSLYGLDPAQLGKGLKLQATMEQRIADMDRLGVDVQVLSTQGQLYCYEEDPSVAIKLHRECNDEMRALVAANPRRFAGLAIVPLQDAELAVTELRRAVTELGLRGVMVGDNVAGALWDEPRFRPFWAAAQELDALVLLHQAPPTMVSSAVRRYHLSNTIGNLVERTVSFASIVFGGVLDEFPRLKICLAHGGGYACFGVGRMDWGWQWRESARTNIDAPPSSYLSRFYYDCITHNEAALRFLVDSVGADRVLFGSDYPGFAAGPEGVGYDPVAWLRDLSSLTGEEKQSILSGNAAGALGL
jgi:aminocarboxymuconate-semialdehyde decarboxylase